MQGVKKENLPAKICILQQAIYMEKKMGEKLERSEILQR
jgi:hypothetical protein